MPPKEEYPPLLPLGFHQKTLAQVRELFVTQFQKRGSTTRDNVMTGLEYVVGKLLAAGIRGEIWVDGSFVTDKIDPSDVDILLMVNGEFFDNATEDQKEIMKWVQSNLKKAHLCDSNLWVEYDRKHPDYWVGEWWRAHWLKLFGFYRDDGPHAYETKGMALLNLPGCDA